MTFSYMVRHAQLNDAEQIAWVHVRGWQENYQGIIEQSFLDAISYEKRLTLRQEILSIPQGNSIHLVACCEDEITGFCDAGPSRDLQKKWPGEIYALYVLKKHQKQGIGSNLWNQAANYLTKQGLTPFITWALEDNKLARAFYEAKGGVISKVKKADIGGRQYREVCYEFEENRETRLLPKKSNNHDSCF